MRESVVQSVAGVIDALNEADMVDDATVREIHALCQQSEAERQNKATASDNMNAIR